MSDVPPSAPDLRPRGMPESMWSRLEEHGPKLEPAVLAQAEKLAAQIVAAVASGDTSTLLQLSVAFDELVP